MTERTALRKQLSALMQESDPQLSDVAFNDLALRIFRFQFEHNTPYRKYCERRAVVPDAIGHWLQVPAVPTAAFKEAALVSGNAEDAEAIFRTSGTTQGKEKRGMHYVLDLDLAVLMDRQHQLPRQGPLADHERPEEPRDRPDARR